MSKSAKKTESDKPEAEKPEVEKPEADNVEKTPPPLTPKQKRFLNFYRGVSFAKGIFHAAFTFAVYVAWAEVVKHLLPPTNPHELFACLVLVVMAFTGWVSGIDIISTYLDPMNLAQHPRVKEAISRGSEKREHKRA